MISQAFTDLVQYGIDAGLTDTSERIYTRNLLLDLLREDGYEETPPRPGIPLGELLRELTDSAVERGIIPDSGENRDIFDAKLMNCLTPRPSQVIAAFRAKYAHSPQEATDYYYRLSGDTNYIRRDRIARDRKWKVPSESRQDNQRGRANTEEEPPAFVTPIVKYRLKNKRTVEIISILTVRLFNII